MDSLEQSNASEVTKLLERARNGDASAVDEIFARHRDRLRRMVQMRLSWRLHGRIDESDVIQEAYHEASRRLEEYLSRPDMPLFLWLRFLVGERLLLLHRRHLGTKMRDVRREISIFHEAIPEASSAALAAQLLGEETSPSEAAVRAERLLYLQEAINRLDPMDREVLSLRHFEQLNRAETAKVLAISEAAAAKRYIRALKRLKQAISQMPGGLEGMR